MKFFRILLVSLTVAATAAVARAQQLDNPVTVPVSYYGEAMTNGAMYASGFSFGAELGSMCAMYRASTPGGVIFNNAATPTTAYVIPGKEYTIQMTAQNVTYVKAAFMQAPGHVIYLNGCPMSSVLRPQTSWSFTFRLERIGDVSQGISGRGGEASSIASDKPIWYLGLGSMRSGESAGAIGFRRGDFSQPNIFTPDGLIFETKDVSEVTVVRTSGVLRQVYSREVLADIQTLTSTSYTIDVYARSSAITWNGSLYSVAGLSPFVSYTVSQRSVAGGTGITIQRAEDNVTWETSLELVGSAATGIWTHRDWRKTSAPTVSKVTSNYSASPVVITHSGRNVDDTGDESPLIWNKTLANYSWGKELARTTYGPNEAVKAETQYSYYTATGSGGVAKSLKWAKFPDGTWSKTDYYDTDSSSGARGMSKRVYRPWENLQADPELASTANSTYEDWTYVANIDGYATLPTSRKLYAPGGTLITESAWVHTLSAGNWNNHTLSKVEQRDYSDASNYLTTTRYYHREDDSTRYFRGKTASVHYPDGRKEAYAYFNGSWNPSTREFTALANGEDRLILAFHGQATVGSQSPAGAPVSSWTLNGLTWNFPSLYMAPTRSTVSEVVVDMTGRTVFTAENAYTASGTLARIAATQLRHDTHGRLYEEVDVSRSVGTNELKRSRTFIGSHVDTATAVDGVVTTYEYDDLLRVRKVTEGFGGSAAYPARITETRYDGANRPARVYRFSTSQQPVLIEYDGAGRLKKSRAPKPDGVGVNYLDTEYTYQAINIVKTRYPNGADRYDETYLDGRPKSVTGSAQAPVSFDYSYTSTGLKVSRWNGPAQSNGWVDQQFDRLGRLKTHTTPAWSWISGTAQTVTTTFGYAASTGLRTNSRVSYFDGTTTTYPVADSLSEYDAAGRLLREGLDVNNNGVLDPASNDRITAYDSWFAADTWGWYSDATVTTYATSSSSTPTEASRVRTRLTGFNQGAMSGTAFVVGDVVSWQTGTWRTLQWSYISPTTKERWTHTRLNGATTPAEESHINGYLEETKSQSNVLTRYEYDSYGRLQYMKGRWDGTSFGATTTYAYHGITDVVSSVATGGITTSYDYAWDSSAQTSTVTTIDAAAKRTHTRANAMGLPWRVWGSAAQPIEYGYDAVGRRTSMKTWRAGSFTADTWPVSPGTGAVTTWVPDAATGLVKEKRHANHVEGTTNRKWTYTYSPLGQLKTRTWARGTTTTYNYSTGLTATGELSSIDYSDTTPDVSYTYMRTGAPYQITDATGTRTFAYRSDLQLDTETLDATFYGAGRKIRASYEDGSSGTVNGRANGYRFGTDSEEENASLYTFDASTGRVSYVRGKTGTDGFNYGYTTGTNWVETVTSEALNTYKRTNLLLANRGVLDSVETKWGATVKGLYDSTFDSRGLRQSVAQSGELVGALNTNTYTYNDRGELTGSSNNQSTWRTFTWDYDLMGKRTTAYNYITGTTIYTQVTDANKDVNEYASITGEAGLSYDADGNLTADGTWNYGYDAENRLRWMQRKAGAQEHLAFDYDYMGRRVKKILSNSDFYVTGCTKFVWSGWRLSAELDGGTNQAGTAVTKTYVWGSDLSGGAGAGGLLSVTQGGATYYPTYDAQGNVTGYLNAGNDGSVGAKYEYNAYGQIIDSGGSPNSFAFGFATQYTDRETGLVYYGLRYYSPKHGRFINRDPIEENGGINLYNFVGNSPANGWDMLGMSNWQNSSEVVQNLIYEQIVRAQRYGSTTVLPNPMESFDGQSWASAKADRDDFDRRKEEEERKQKKIDDYVKAHGHLPEYVVNYNRSTEVTTGSVLGSVVAISGPGIVSKIIGGIGSVLKGALNLVAPNSGGIDPSGKGDIGTYLVRQNAAGDWVIVGKTNGVTTAHAYVNGILGTLGRHAELGGKHMPKGVTEFTLFNNPSKGFFRDIWETTMDKLGFTSAPAMALAGVLQGVQASGQSVEWVAHSQGGAIFSEAMRYAGGDLSANSVTFNAGANNHWVTNGIAADVGVQVRGYYYSSWDAVPNVIGMNGNPFSMLGSVLASPLLFTDNHSPHTAPTPGWAKRW